jgi:hypothetical protein
MPDLPAGLRHRHRCSVYKRISAVNPTAGEPDNPHAAGLQAAPGCRTRRGLFFTRESLLLARGELLALEEAPNPRSKLLFRQRCKLQQAGVQALELTFRHRVEIDAPTPSRHEGAVTNGEDLGGAPGSETARSRKPRSISASEGASRLRSRCAGLLRIWGPSPRAVLRGYGWWLVDAADAGDTIRKFGMLPREFPP